MCIRFIWGNNREVTTRPLIYKPKKLGILRAIDLGTKVKIALCKNVSQAMSRRADWTGVLKTWKKKRG